MSSDRDEETKGGASKITFNPIKSLSSSAILTVCSALYFGICLYSLKVGNEDDKKRTSKAEGTMWVTDMLDNSVGNAVMTQNSMSVNKGPTYKHTYGYSFKDDNGKTHQNADNNSYKDGSPVGKYIQNQKVLIEYEPADPTNNNFSSDMSTVGMLIVCIISGGVMAGFGVNTIRLGLFRKKG